MIYGQHGGQQARSGWSTAMSAAMGSGIVPRSTEEPGERTTARWPWSRMRDAGTATEAAPRA
ncbi:hypothetical protein [Microbacterium proteolyticum]|jgi:hypothetical protein|uniref:hypothetical protein n=1 Tax=Microbacterium proteolyticum TaxID=1572644 RepID=UPI001FAC9747|nr:hypothetical protein [Microbacterium proteolyticum]MCI9859291.1 hypothetical protein [Microbacterium proteolyticum]